MHPLVRGKTFVYLAYIDDSDTKAKQQKWQVLGAVLIPDSWVFPLELVTSDVISRLMGDERHEDFTEFHACEMYGGYGIFEPIAQAKRFAAIEEMLRVLHTLRAKIAYGAINLEHLKRQPYASANPLDISFRMCVEGIGSFFHRNAERVSMGKEPDGESGAIHCG